MYLYFTAHGVAGQRRGEAAPFQGLLGDLKGHSTNHAKRLPALQGASFPSKVSYLPQCQYAF
jgi:hypothetical protein